MPSSSVTRSRRRRFGTRTTSSPNAMFAATVRHGNSE